MEYSSYIIAAIICFIPLISGLVIYKIYNIIQGIITFFVTSFLMFYVLNIFLNHYTFLSIEQINLIIDVVKVPYNLIYYTIIKIPKLDDIIFSVDIYLTLTITIFVYCISQILSTSIKRLKNL